MFHSKIQHLMVVELSIFRFVIRLASGSIDTRNHLIHYTILINPIFILKNYGHHFMTYFLNQFALPWFSFVEINVFSKTAHLKIMFF